MYRSLCVLSLTFYILICYRLGTVFIYIKFIFKNLVNVPTEAAVLKAANDKLKSNLKSEGEDKTQRLGQPVSIENITFYSKSFVIGP